jgi:biopolymer transport protein ExbB
MTRARRAIVLGLLLLAAFGTSELMGDDEPTPGERLAKAIEDTRAEIEDARKRLAARRDEITTERIELSRKAREAEADVRRMREELEEGRRREEAEASELADLSARALRVHDEVANSRLLLTEMRRNLEAQLSLVDSHALAGDLGEIDRLIGEAMDPAAIPAAADAVLDALAGHLESASRVRRSSGAAVAPDGRSLEGTFVQIGDVIALFAASGSERDSGIVILAHGSPLPHVFTDLSGDERAAVAGAAAGREEAVPIDITGGAALRTRRARPTLVDQFVAGGVVMYPILGIAVIGLVIGVLKLLSLARVRIDFDARVEEFAALLTAGNAGEAEGFAKHARRPMRRVLLAAFEHREAPRAELEEILNEAVLGEVPGLERRISVLAVGAAVAPLLGLLGTVTGMIHTFRLISVFGTGDPRLLSAGISEALLTTEAGLVVAIPLLLIHAFLSRRVQRITEALDTSAVSLLNRMRTGKEAA